MTTKETGGPAFPSVQEVLKAGGMEIFAKNLTSGGMTLRDYFAAKALNMKFAPLGSSISKEQMASECYAMADAMIAERNK